MYNPFYVDQEDDLADNVLVSRTIEGDRKALETLMTRYHIWIYNIAYKMVGDPLDAEDVTQEIMIKILTKLSTFKGQSRFRTWLYRIVKNHVLNMQKRKRENQIISFDRYWKSIAETPDAEQPDPNLLPVDLSLILKETRVHCMMGMLLCLDRMQRLVFILGELFDVGESLGSELLEISKANYRQILSRSRKHLYLFMEDKCGLIREGNPCYCNKKLKSLLDCGAVNPLDLKFTTHYLYEFNKISMKKYASFSTAYEEQCRRLFRENPVYHAPSLKKFFQTILASQEFKEVIDFKF
jgi:RNA polymerase sigma factor (sigma-70 family)